MLCCALASVWSQDPALPDQVVAVDDGSTDDTANVGIETGAEVIRHARNFGLSAARNTGLRAAGHFLDRGPGTPMTSDSRII